MVKAYLNYKLWGKFNFINKNPCHQGILFNITIIAILILIIIHKS